MRQPITFTLCIAILSSATILFACKKSNNSTSSSNDKSAIVGNWANVAFIDATSPGSPADTSYANPGFNDTISFTATGNLYAKYYAKQFNINTGVETWSFVTDSANYSFTTDTSFVSPNLNTESTVFGFGNDTMYIRSMTSSEMTVYSPDISGVGGGYYYIYKKF